MRIRVVRGDICTVRADAVVTAGNRSLVGGSGVNGAIHAAAGPELLAASRALAPCEAGSAVVTPAFGMTSASWVIHAVGPIYAGPQDEPVLASAYTASLARADEVGARSVAFPAISTGVYGYPVEDAARVSVCRAAGGGHAGAGGAAGRLRRAAGAAVGAGADLVTTVAACLPPLPRQVRVPG